MFEIEFKFWFGFGLVPTCKRPGAVPTLNLPEKRIPLSTSTTAPRREFVRHDTKPKQTYSKKVS